ncbi:anti-sigma regulatory factor (Ser/Thr protein kinase) [Humitalea rosea]|uniref:Anti-sigma regulatory factor (Ser/Thr protein kinase) n=1 Tax=Humitalea rosea TaxID=990373 RepID=A0A2W7HWU6_9PROT|nr:ATP-binding protein [Humitalea rosea]PZW38528.1 anti-sigma regulatory factor (Ser/Thr protein kinase) [Humitalea rosea]
MTRRLTLRVTGGSAEVSQAQATLVAWLEEDDADPRTIARAELLVEEIALNALDHGQARGVTIAATRDEDGLGLVFEDDGGAFDPTTAPLPDLERALEEATIGGRGLVLLRKLATALRYERTAEGHNRLSMTLS